MNECLYFLSTFKVSGGSTMFTIHPKTFITALLEVNQERMEAQSWFYFGIFLALNLAIFEKIA